MAWYGGLEMVVGARPLSKSCDPRLHASNSLSHAFVQSTPWNIVVVIGMEAPTYEPWLAVVDRPHGMD